MGSGSTSSTAEAKLADIGVIGLGVMGQNLALNLDDHGYVVSCYNRTTLHLTDFLNGAARGTKVRGAMSLPDLVQSLRMPRKILLMVKAGQPVDDLIEVLTPLLQRGDILIDGGNSHFRDTDRRCKLLESKGLLYLGCGISGGEEGARHGPSLMPGGSPSAWDALAPIFCDIAAKVDVRSCIDAKNFAYFPKSVDAVPCAAYVGPLGAGHFVKMVHNGIEYGDMQLIGECFHVLLERSPPVDVAATFKEWSMAPELDSFLAEITCDILSRHAPDEPSGLLVSRIRDVAGQKGTGKWTVMSGLEDLPSGAPVTLIAESVFARILSSLKADRLRVSAIYARPQGADDADGPLSLDDLKSALIGSRLVSYAQGFQMLLAATKDLHYQLNLASIATLWMGGCIIRSRLLTLIHGCYVRRRDVNLFEDAEYAGRIKTHLGGWRRCLQWAVGRGVPVPGMASALTFLDGYTSAILPGASLIQAQRDYFGAHTFEWMQQPGEFVHYDWQQHQ